MPVARIEKIKAWSFSRFRDYDGCPKKAFYKHVKRMIEPIPSPEDEPDHPLNRGSRIHKECEDYLTNGHDMTEGMESFAEEFKALLADVENCHVEQQWCFKKDWSLTDWFSRAAWCRVKLDCAHLVRDGVLRTIDFKTGKVNPKKIEEYEEQLSLYALAAFLMFADVNEIEGELWFLDWGVIIAEGIPINDADPNGPKYEDLNYTREKDFEKLMARWENRVRPMLMDGVFAPNPTFACTWCYFSQKKGGVCPAG